MRPLSELLSLAYGQAMHLAGSAEISRPALLEEARALPRADLEAARDRLLAVEQRCVVSRTQRGFLDEALAGAP